MDVLCLTHTGGPVGPKMVQIDGEGSHWVPFQLLQANSAGGECVEAKFSFGNFSSQTSKVPLSHISVLQRIVITYWQQADI